MKTLFKNAKIVGRKEVVKGSLLVQNGAIRGYGNANTKADKVIDCKGRYLLPGLFDTHMHGIHGYNFLGRTVGETLVYDEALHHITNFLPRIGVTSSLISTYAMPQKKLEDFLVKARAYQDAAHPGNARLWGIDLEGNFLKEPAFAGAQDHKNALKPSVELFKRFQAKAGGHIKKVLVAPEWGEPAFKLIRHIADHSGVPSAGHTGCSRDEMLKAYDCGMRVIVHCGNGPMSQNFKSGGALDGIFELGSKLFGEIICDMSHVHPRWVNTFINCFSFSGVLGVSDSLSNTGFNLKDGTRIGECVVRNGALWIINRPNTLAGSVSSLDMQFNKALNLITSDRKAYFQQETPAPMALPEALVNLSRMYSFNPAASCLVSDCVGSLETGKFADIVVADFPGRQGAYKFKIEQVYLAGERVV